MGPGRRNGWEVRERQAEPALYHRENWTGLAAGKGGGAPHSPGAGPEPFSLWELERPPGCGISAQLPRARGGPCQS